VSVAALAAHELLDQGPQGFESASHSLQDMFCAVEATAVMLGQAGEMLNALLVVFRNCSSEFAEMLNTLLWFSATAVARSLS
jgi:hypothetical protein